jgi:hypothetical protein
MVKSPMPGACAAAFTVGFTEATVCKPWHNFGNFQGCSLTEGCYGLI